VAVSDNPELKRFELTMDGLTALITYERTPGTLRLIHTEVPEGLRGRHVGEALVEAALRAGRSEGLRIVAICPFVRAYMRRHPPSA
jgi:predicted GNAT family acetyltransferase